MDSSFCGECPSILQLHKWDPSQLQLNLSEFREAFISPTRELLLLVSYQCEALLLPLTRGDPLNGNFLQSSQGESLQTSCPLEQHVGTSNLTSRSDLKDDFQCTSGSATDFDYGVPLECKFPKSHSYPFVFDVKSLAWGVCGDMYNQHRDVLFREFLFVCSSQGVIVHAFCHSDQTSALDGTTEGDFGQGRWMGWGPSESDPIMEEVSSTSCCEDTVTGGNFANGDGETPERENGYDGLSRSSASKRWLHSFFSKVETVESGGTIWTKFPGRLAFPSSAKVVSFSIFDNDSPLVDFPSHGASSNKDEYLQEAVLDIENDSHMTSSLSSSGLNHKYTVSPDIFSVGRNGLCKCFRVFSSNSHRVIGFIFNLVDLPSVSVSHESEGSRGKKLLILIARLDGWGIQWVSSVKLEEHVSKCPVVEWTDFCFSDNLLVCLNASGFMFFYDAMSGDHVVHLDILQVCGLSPQSKLHERLPVAANRQIKQVDEVCDNSTYKADDFVRKRTFRRLIVASYTSLLAAVDEYGVIYVICAADYVPDRYNSCDKFLPDFRSLGLGILVGWEVAGFDIGHQKLQGNFSCSPGVNDSSTWNGNSNFLDNPGGFLSKELHDCKHYSKEDHCDFCLSGFSSASKILSQRSLNSGVKSCLMRKIILPINGHDENDCIFFSPLGITRFIRKHDMRDHNSRRIVHFDLRTFSGIHDDRCLDIGGQTLFLQGQGKSHVGEAVGCTFQGCFYLVTETGLSVVLPSVSVSSNFLPLETIGYCQTGINTCIQHQGKSAMEITQLKQPWSPWKVEVLDRVLLYEGPEEADRLCFENGWDLKISRIRWLQLALHYLNFDEVARSLEMLVDVNLAEEGILRLLFAAIFLMVHKNRNDTEVSAASRLLSLATSFATKMIRNYGSLKLKKDAYILQGFEVSHLLSRPPVLKEKDHNDSVISGKLHEMARFLEIIRTMQCQLSEKYKKSGQGSVDIDDMLSLVDMNVSQDEYHLSIVTPDSVPSEAYDGQEISFPVSEMGSNNAEKLALVSKDTLDSITDDSEKVSALVPQAKILGKNVLPLENPKDMMARWKLDNLDLKTVVKDALLSGRLPLAVLQLHLHHSKDFTADRESPDTFTEVRDIGRAIAYDLFLKGETGLAVLTLQRLGEDIEICLKQLLFGTVRRSLRLQVAEEMRRFGYLGPYELKMLERILLIERLYPSSSFWKTFSSRQKELTTFTSSSCGRANFCLLHPHFFNDIMIECGEIDGVILGSWTSFSEEYADLLVDDDGARAGYWVAAAVWSNAWDQRTIDRIVLDQPFLMGIHVLWESKLEYYICHNDWEEVLKLLDLIPTSVLLNGSLQVALDGLRPTSVVEGDADFPDNGRYICSVDELDAVCMDIPGIRIFRFSGNPASCMWLWRLMEQKLARNLIFLKEYWVGTTEIVSLMARSGFITRRNNIPVDEDVAESLSNLSFSSSGERRHVDTMQALHKLVVHHCVRQNLPNLLDLYLDAHMLALDNASLCSLLEAAGDCQWARWLLLSRIKGREYDASFSNARSVMSRALTPDSSLNVLDVDEIICNVDDIAEGGGELAALATLMYASAPIQNCLSSGSVKRHSGSSAQCTLENLRPTLQHFTTVWRTLLAACLGQDKASNFVVTKTNNVLTDYLNWRDNVFFSSTRDTSLLQMLPCWFPKAVRRLIQLYVQGPLGWQSVSCLPTGESLLDRDIDCYINAEEHTEISAISWEATIQKHVEEELYDSSIEETGIGLEHHLHRGRALAAFNHILGIRVQKLKSEGQPRALTHGQANVHSDVQTLLAPIVPNEESLLSFVIPLAITHFEDSVLVASCAFLLELCGLSASMLRVDIAALRRISLYYKTTDNSENYIKLSNGSAFHAVSHEGDALESLARALAEDYLHQHTAKTAKATPNSSLNKQPSRALMLVLQYLENASLPLMVQGKTCGSWLSTGDGDGNELRSQQKVASQHWNLVTAFCQMHQLPLSTKYLVVLARDNDWVGFLSEAQVGGYTFDTVVQVASKEFGDPRLKFHILTVLKAMQSRKKPSSSSYLDAAEENQTFFSDENIYNHAELFRILADCEQQKNPGEVLLKKAKELSWSVLAMIASCFPDVSPLFCLTVWLEITAARETSSIKVNDIASQISNNVGAAVEATNIPPAGNKILTLHYNRQNPKRRRLMEPISVDLMAASSDVSSAYSIEKISPRQGLMTEEKSKLEIGEKINVSSDSEEGPASLSKMVAVLCEQRLFVPLLRAFDMFLPSSSLLPFIRALQAFSQMRLSEASAHLGSFSARVKEEPYHVVSNTGREGKIGKSWMSSAAVKAADAMLSTCPSPYDKRCLLQLLAATDFGDGGSAAAHYRRLYWKINLAEPSLRKDSGLHLGNEILDDGSLLTALEKSGYWEQARNWARQLEASGGPWKSAIHHVTESQAESMVAEWKEFLWDVPEERVALWGHCQMLFIRYSFPALQAGLFFLRHAEAVEKDLPARELHELLLLSLQWLSGMITLSNPVYPLYLLREIETRVWLLAVESEAQVKNEGEFTLNSSGSSPLIGNTANIIDRTATIITKMDNHINTMRNRTSDKQDAREYNLAHHRNQVADASSSTVGGNMKTKRRAKGYASSRRSLVDSVDKNTDPEDGSALNYRNDVQLLDENVKIELSSSKWEERVGPAELERAILSLLEFGQITAARQLQQKLSPAHVPSEFMLVDVALKLAALSTPCREVSILMLDEEVCTAIQSYNIPSEHLINPLQVLESLAEIFTEGSGRGLCRRIIAVVKAANILGLSFSEAFDKQPVELLQLLSLKAQESFQEANLLVQTHPMPASSIAQILAESFLKGLLAAHRGGYMDSQKEEGPAPLLWRFSDFLKWAELCPSEPEIGHALMRLVITGQEIPHSCEVELLILSHHFYKSSACLDGVDVLVALAATRVEAYVSEGDFPCLARLITGVGNFHTLNFILGILIENGQLDLLLQKYSAAADTNTGTAEAVRGFRMAVLTSLQHFNPNDLDAFAMVYNHFDMKHETAALLESRAEHSCQQWFRLYNKDQNEDLLESMRYFIEAAEVHSSIDAGNKTRRACAQASLVSLQIRMPDVKWLNLSETNARRVLVEQSRFQEALIVAEAYGLNQPTEWVLVLWNQMLKPELTEEFVAEFVAVLPLQASMLVELARFYRAEVAARGDQSQFSVWLTGGGLPAEWAKYLGRSFRCLLKRTRDLRLRLQLATIATGFTDVVDACTKVLDRVPDAAGPLVLRKGHGGAYLPLM